MANARLEYLASACCLEMRWAAWLICQTTIEQLQTQSHLLRVWTQTQLQPGTESSGTNKKASKIRRRKNHRENKHRAVIVPVSTSPDASHSYDKKPCQAPTRTLKLSAEAARAPTTRPPISRRKNRTSPITMPNTSRVWKIWSLFQRQ